jgi:hypothetical protein
MASLANKRSYANLPALSVQRLFAPSSKCSDLRVSWCSVYSGAKQSNAPKGVTRKTVKYRREEEEGE